MSKKPHIGKLIQKAVKTRGLTVTEFADQIHYSRRNVYQIFEKDNIDTDLLDKIHKVLGDDFLHTYLKERYHLPTINKEQYNEQETTQHNKRLTPPVQTQLNDMIARLQEISDNQKLLLNTMSLLIENVKKK